MRDFYCKIIRELEEEIGIRYIDNGDQISLCESMIEITLQKLTKLKRFINENEFKTIEDEIIFFKELKPKIVSKLIYYNAIYKIEMKKPHGGQRIIKKYLNNELAKLKRFFDNNLEFYKYYRTNSTYLDEKYFVRGKFDIKLSLDTFYFESDHSFSTSHDYKVAKVIFLFGFYIGFSFIVYRLIFSKNIKGFFFLVHLGKFDKKLCRYRFTTMCITS